MALRPTWQVMARSLTSSLASSSAAAAAPVSRCVQPSPAAFAVRWTPPPLARLLFASAPAPPNQLRAALVLRCPDRPGIVSRISATLSDHRANLTSLDTFVDQPDVDSFRAYGGTGDPEAHFVARAVFEFQPDAWPLASATAAFQTIAQEFGASHFKLQFASDEHKPRVAILAGPTSHCLVDLLQRYQTGLLPVVIAAVISNHPLSRLDASTGYIASALDSLDVPFLHFPTRKDGGGGGGGMHRDVGADGLSASRREHEILSALRDADTDFLVLARYMQVLSAGFLRAYGRDVLNIHHGLLPSFKGGHPYRQAYVAGVRVIGATAHYVTEHLDEGPIVAQNVISVTHRQSLSAIKDLSQRLETETLSDAVALVANARVVRISLGRLAVMN